MTMPHLMNCPHRGGGWCLECVKKLGEENMRLLDVVELLPKTADGIPVYPGMFVWFYSPRGLSKSIDKLKVVGWDWLPNLGPDHMHCISVVDEHGDSDGVNLACCYSTFEAAENAKSGREPGKEKK